MCQKHSSVFEFARRAIRLKYVPCGRDPDRDGGVDCYGLVILWAKECGAAIPDFAGYGKNWREAEAYFSDNREEVAVSIDRTDASPGDLVLFRIHGQPGRTFDHVGIWLTGGRFLHARKAGVAVESISQPPFNHVPVEFRRFRGGI